MSAGIQTVSGSQVSDTSYESMSHLISRNFNIIPSPFSSYITQITTPQNAT